MMSIEAKNKKAEDFMKTKMSDNWSRLTQAKLKDASIVEKTNTSSARGQQHISHKRSNFHNS